MFVRLPIFPILFLLFYSLLLPQLLAQASTLHLIASIDVLNDDIREGCEKDYVMVRNLFQSMAQDAGMAFRLKRLPFEIDEVEDFVGSFRCNPNDAVVFFYSGHGVRYSEEDEERWPWPYLYYCEKQAGAAPLDCELDMETVIEGLSAASPRLLIVLGDNCNDLQGDEEMNDLLSMIAALQERQGSTTETTYNNLELITRSKGQIIASAASPGQAAFTNSEGSHFANALYHQLLDAFTSQRPTSWERILRSTRNKVLQLSEGEQTPQFSVNGVRQ